MKTRTPEPREIEQRRAIVNARDDLALRERLDARVNGQQPLPRSASPGIAKGLSAQSGSGTDMLVREAHRVLVHYLPGAELPVELWKLRAMLDAHMFGRDKRVCRDDVVRMARQIDRVVSK